jgi:signal transduction histidine kinase
MELRVATAEGRFEEEGWRLRKDGTRFWANVVITALRDPTGQLVGFAKVTRDLTERREAQQRAIADASVIAASDAANRAKSEFLATMSHELRTPLNAIGGYAELIDVGIAGPVTPEQHDYITRIRAAQQHLLGIITDLLNYSRIAAGQITCEEQPVDVGAVATHALEMVALQARARSITVQLCPCPDDLVALADAQKVEQIVLNLLSNALKFAPTGGIVRVRCDRQGDVVTLSVTDNGPGIPVDKHAAVFEPFVQVGRSLATPQQGTGLGLAISRDLARAMCGDLTLESVPGQGATFTLSLKAR